MNRKWIFTVIVLVAFKLSAQHIYKRATKLMGCGFDVTVVANNQAKGHQYIDVAIGEIKRIENIISSWNPNSQTSFINKNAGIKPVKVSVELIELIERAKAISRVTDGAFDITYASMDRIWKFDGSMVKLPSPERVKQSITKVGFKNIQINHKEQTVFLPKKGMKIGFGAIGKGYAADKAKALLQKQGVLAGIINASGDMNTWGMQPNGKPWTVVITNPLNKKNAFATLPISNKAVVTSGDYEKFVMIAGQKYAHIINPKTGYPTKGISSVSVFAPKAELADALATSVFVMGIKVGLDRINQLPDVDCLVVDDQGNIYTSKNLKIDQWEKQK